MARKRFETTPIFIGDVTLDASGEGLVSGRMPENLTTFRITAIASATLPGSKATGRFGHAEDRTRVTVPLAIRVVTPRVLRPGDEAELAAVVDNLGGPAGTLVVSLELPGKDGDLVALGPLEFHRAIAAGGQVRVPFPVLAKHTGAGRVRMRVALTPSAKGHDALSDVLRDAMEVSVPVTRERTLVRRTAVYGSLARDEPIAVAVAAPQDMLDGTGKLEVRVDASLLNGLQDIARQLVDYPYGCVEQTSSGLIPLVALGELAQEYQLGIEDLDVYVASGVARLRSMQLDDGGLGYWPGASHSHLYATAYAVWVLERVRKAGFPVDEATQGRALAYLVQRVDAWARREATSVHDDAPIAMALHALSLSGRAPERAVARMYDLAPTMPMFARALLAMALHQLDPGDPRTDELVEMLVSALDHREGMASVRTDGAIFAQYFDSGPRTDAMVLLALVHARPEHPAVEPLARGLMALRMAGRVRNTQENAYALLALAAYARKFETDVPRLTADVWIGDARVVSHEVRGDRFDSVGVERSLSGLVEEASPRITIRREGEGRLYYRVGMSWSPDGEQDQVVSNGVAVSTLLRSARGQVGPTAQIESGTLLALDVTVTMDAALPYIAVDIPLPAGLEAIDTSIGKGRRAMVLKGTRGWWASYEEIRSDRVLLFADRLPAGAHTHTIYLRATTPGRFEMPPTVAQSMYFPEVSGHTARRRIDVAALSVSSP